VGKPVVPELIQHRLTRWNLVEELKKLLYNQDSRLKIIEGYNKLFTSLGGEGASQRCAKLIVQYLQKK
jgi:lipid-A-disaccharide synthase